MDMYFKRICTAEYDRWAGNGSIDLDLKALRRGPFNLTCIPVKSKSGQPMCVHSLIWAEKQNKVLFTLYRVEHPVALIVNTGHSCDCLTRGHMVTSMGGMVFIHRVLQGRNMILKQIPSCKVGCDM